MDNPEDEGGELRRQSRRLVEASRRLVDDAKNHVQNSEARLERARNLLQASWLWRALRKRQRRP